MLTKRLRRNGNSIGFIINKTLLELLGWREGTIVELRGSTIGDETVLEVRKARVKKGAKK